MKVIKENEGRLNFHDALISLFMREQGLKHIVSFDTDFDEVKEVTRIGSEEVPIPMKSPSNSEAFRQSVPKHCATPVGA